MKYPRTALALCLTLAVILVMLAGRPVEGKPEGSGDGAGKPVPGQHALLVGVTKYPELPEELWLSGGAGDVLLMRELLEKKYRFPPENITILSEEEGSKHASRLPTRVNIERECRRLAGVVKKGGKGQKVVVLFSGHGSQQPDPKAGNEGIFLPRDVRGWDRTAGVVPGALGGRELGDLLRPLVHNDTLLWVIVDACNSGRLVRGGRERDRQVDPIRGLKVPAKAIQDADKRAKKLTPRAPLAASEPTMRVPLAAHKGVVLTYACLAWERTVEDLYPHPETGIVRSYGLLTWTLNCVLRSATAPLTYHDLLVRIQNLYTANNREWPTPMIEGTFQNKAILAHESLPRVNFVFEKRGDTLTVNAGQLHGLTNGSLLAVYPPPGVKGDLKGYVRIKRITPIRARVEPVEHAGMKALAPEDIVAGRCEVAELVYDDLRLKVAVDSLGSKPADPRSREETQRLQKQLADLKKTLDDMAGKSDSAIEVTREQQADWLVRVDDGKVFLLPGPEWADERPAGDRRRLGPAPAGAKLQPWLKNSFAKIIRVVNLVVLADRAVNDSIRTEDDFRTRVEVEVRRSGEKLQTGPTTGIKSFHQDDEIVIRIHNPSTVSIDVTLLRVNSQLGIEPLFPLKNEGNRVKADGTVTLRRSLGKKTAGREQLIVLAVAAQGEDLTDFVALAQEDIEGVRRAERLRGTRSGLKNALGRLLMKGMYGAGEGPMRMKSMDVASYTAMVVPVQVHAGNRPK